MKFCQMNHSMAGGLCATTIIIIHTTMDFFCLFIDLMHDQNETETVLWCGGGDEDIYILHIHASTFLLIWVCLCD